MGPREQQEDQASTCDSLHFHPPSLDPSLGQALLRNDATDVIRKNEGGLKDGEGFGMRAGSWLVYDDIQGPAVVFHSCHLHVLQGARKEMHGVSKDWS